jgi:HEPN domain-containing protein
MAQALHDLAHAERARTAGDHDWACFAAQQAAEKAVKALHLHRGQEAWGHVVRRLLEELPEPLRPDPDLLDRARCVDQFYMPTRYANAHPEGAPFQHFGARQSAEAIEHARAILDYCHLQMAAPK